MKPNGNAPDPYARNLATIYRINRKVFIGMVVRVPSDAHHVRRSLQGLLEAGIINEADRTDMLNMLDNTKGKSESGIG